MPTYVICGPSDEYRQFAQLLYPKPYYWILDNSSKPPIPKKEYTVILLSDWFNHPQMGNDSMDRFLLDARLIDTTNVSRLKSLYTARPCLFCDHLSHKSSTSIIRSSTGYLFLCSYCIVAYALNGVPDLPDLIFSSINTTHAHTFPEEGEV